MFGGLLFDYLAVRNAIEKSGLVHQFKNNDTVVHNCEQNLKILLVDNRTLRQKLVRQKNTSICCIGFWMRKFEINVEKYFKIAKNTTKETRLRLLHFKILHNIYPTGILLHKMKIRETNKCVFCNETDFLEHFFFLCQSLIAFWKRVEHIIHEVLNIKVTITAPIALFGLTKDNTRVSVECIQRANHILLIAKICIRKMKYGKIKYKYIDFDRE